MSKIKKVHQILNIYSKNLTFKIEDKLIFLSGELSNYQDIVDVGLKISKTHLFEHVINDIKLKDYQERPMNIPSLIDKKLDNFQCDVLIIGAGVIGAAIFRELTKYDLNILLIDKENDVGLHASSRNDGNIHVGIDLKHNSKKFKYLKASRKLNPQLFKELDIDFIQSGQSIAFSKKKLFPIVAPYLKLKGLINGVHVKFYFGKNIQKVEPNLNEEIPFIAHFIDAGQISPYEYVIALAESGIINGGKVSLNTYVKEMKLENNKIINVVTNRGTIYPKIVINAAGAFTDQIALMANDRFYSIHPRKGTDIILDPKVFGKLSHNSTGYRNYIFNKSSSKGGGVVPTVDGNSLVGPDAIEVIDREDFSVSKESIENIFLKNHHSFKALSKKDIIAYFSGIRAATYEEDFIVEKGRKTKNIVHVAGIQSPGLTAASGIAQDVARILKEELYLAMPINKNFNPNRKNILKIKKLSLKERDELIKKNPDYGVIVCRCGEISKGEIIDAINRPLKVSTIDAIKRRVRAGMGRCQGGFCQPLVLSIIAAHEKLNLEDVIKKGESHILKGKNKEL